MLRSSVLMLTGPLNCPKAVPFVPVTPATPKSCAIAIRLFPESTIYNVPTESYVSPSGALNWPMALPAVPKESKKFPLESKALNPIVSTIRHGDCSTVSSHRDIEGRVEFARTAATAAIVNPDEATAAKARVSGERRGAGIEFPDLIADSHGHINISGGIHIKAGGSAYVKRGWQTSDFIHNGIADGHPSWRIQKAVLGQRNFER